MSARARVEIRCRLRRLVAGGDTGSSTAEAALLTPLLVALLLLVVLCGRLVTAKMDLQAAASAAARSRSPGSQRGIATPASYSRVP